MTKTRFWNVASAHPERPDWLHHSCSAAGKNPVQKDASKKTQTAEYCHLFLFYERLQICSGQIITLD